MAIVRGEVYYQDKLLRKRDKIKMKGQLKFSSARDYVKLSGPGGLYTIKPNDEPTTTNEFLVALKEELFPKVRRHTTSANTAVNFFSASYFNLYGPSYTFFDKTRIYRKVPPLKPGEELGFLLETDQGLLYRTASIKDSFLLIKRANFKLPKIKGRTPVIKKTAIVQVMEKDRWLKLIQGKDSIAALKDSVIYYDSQAIQTAPVSYLDPETGEAIIEEPPTFAAKILDEMTPPRFVKRRKMAKDLRFHLRKSKASDIETFLDEYEYDDYIWDTYGNLYDGLLNSVLRKELRLTSAYD